jgi:hypothetical protein
MKKIMTFTGAEMETQCKYCKRNPESCNIYNKLLSKRTGIELCPDRLDVFKIEFEDYKREIIGIMGHFDIDTAKKWDRPYMIPLTIYLDGVTSDGKVIFNVKYHDEFERNEPAETFEDEITDLIYNVFTDTVDETCLKDALCNH